MKVYEVTASAKPTTGGFPHYAPLVMASGGAGRMFTGRPYSQKWKAPVLRITMPLLPRPDFFNFGTGTFVCTERAVELAGEPLEMAGELLPATIKDELGNYFIFNVVNCIDAIDVGQSVWSGEYQSRDGPVRLLARPAFAPQRLGEISLFKIPNDGGTRIYCFERTGDPEDGEFKAVTEHHKLMGLEFKLIWSHHS